MTQALFSIHPPQRILVISLRFLGDALLTTPLLNSLARAYPDSQIDILVYKNIAPMLEGNPVIHHCIGCTQKPTWREYQQLIKQLFRQYDLAISTQTGDRPTLYAVLAAPIRIGFTPHPTQKGGFKRYFYQRSLIFDEIKTHTVLEVLRLCQLLAIQPVYQLTPPSTQNPIQVTNKPYIVMHVLPQWRYKQWPRENWLAIADYCHQQGLQIILSGSPDKQERAYLNTLQAKMPADTLNLAGNVSLAQLAMIIKKAVFFIGPDTGITHLATATGVTTLALFGPSDPVKWAPWPINYHCDHPPFKTKGNQQVNNVYLFQYDRVCVPCYFEGCDRHRQSISDCLEALSPLKIQQVLEKRFNFEAGESSISGVH
jgi:heptosyltransferase-3